MPDQRLEQRTEGIYDEEMRKWEREKESRERKESKVEKSLPPKPERKIHVPEEVKIPVVRLEKPKIETKPIEIDGKVPEIKEEIVEVKIPIITLEKPEVRFRQIKLDCELPSIRAEERKLNVPPNKARQTERSEIYRTHF